MRLTFYFFLTFYFVNISATKAINNSSNNNTRHLIIGDKIHLPSKSPIWIENSKIIKAEEESSGISIKGIGQGSSLVRQNGKTFSIHVLSAKQFKSFEVLSQVCRKTLNLNAEFKDGFVVISGQLLRLQDWRKVFDACYPNFCDFEMQATIEKDIKTQFPQFLSEISTMTAIPRQNIQWSKSPLVQLSPKDPQAHKLKSVFQSLGIRIIEDSDAVVLAPLIRLQITVAEVRRQEFQKLGIQWPSNLTAQTLPKFELDYSSATGAIHFLEEKGYGKTLASPTVLCRSGKEAEFFAGGEIPIKVFDLRTRAVNWRKYGIILRFKPQADFSGRMSLEIETEVSNLDSSTAIDGIPGILINKIKSHFDLKEPRTIMLSGLIRSEDGHRSEGLAGLSKIPIIGSLFSSKDFLENRTELLVFVRPEIDNEEGGS